MVVERGLRLGLLLETKVSPQLLEKLRKKGMADRDVSAWIGQ